MMFDPITATVVTAVAATSAGTDIMLYKKEKDLEKQLKSQRIELIVLESLTGLSAAFSIFDTAFLRSELRTTNNEFIASVQALNSDVGNLINDIESLKSRMTSIETTNASILTGLGRRI